MWRASRDNSYEQAGEQPSRRGLERNLAAIAKHIWLGTIIDALFWKAIGNHTVAILYMFRYCRLNVYRVISNMKFLQQVCAGTINTTMYNIYDSAKT